MNRKNTLSRSIALGLSTFSGVVPLTASAAGELEEVIVTATKRAANLQDVAITVTALTGDRLDELNVGNFEDYVRFLPSVNFAGRGPGQNSIFIRGMATDSSDQTSIEIGAPVPNVALYLDEQPVSSGGRNLDVYAADLERIEVLPGPQGTLFGSSSQAGTLRMITRKPVFNEFQTGFDASLSSTKSGDASNSVEAYINYPLIDDRLAVRAVAYNALQGGYIDNVFGENSFDAGDVSFPEGAASTVVNNLPFVEKDFNDARYTGGRVALRFAPNDDWNFLAQVLYQELDVDGVFDHSPEEIAELSTQQAGSRIVGDLKVQRFFPDNLNDEFAQFALTVNGRLGALNVVYAGSYLDRDVDNTFDYSGYTDIGDFGYYYLCQPDYTLCGDPTQGVIAFIKNERFTHELRFSYDEGKYVNFVAGVFYDDIETKVDTNFFVGGSTGFFAPNRPHSQSTQFNPDPRPPGITFVNDAIRDEEQIAGFGEVTVNVTDTFSLTGGIRYYDIETSLVGSSNFATLGDVDEDGGISFDEVFAGSLPLNENDFIFKGNASWKPLEDLLLYFTFSEGFRPGGFNRIDDEGVPRTFVSDDVTNFEIGWKTSFFDNRLRFNGAVYRVEWDALQIGITDFDISVITFTANAGSAQITGFEGDVAWLATDGLTLTGAWSFNDTQMERVPPNVTDIAGPGSRLALAPELQFNVSGRYEWSLGNVNPYAQVIYTYTDDQFSSIVVENRFPQRSYDLLDASLGLRKDNWGVEVFVQNITDERAQLFINSLDTDLRITTNRPRTFGLKVSYDY